MTLDNLTNNIYLNYYQVTIAISLPLQVENNNNCSSTVEIEFRNPYPPETQKINDLKLSLWLYYVWNMYHPDPYTINCLETSLQRSTNQSLVAIAAKI